MEDIKIYAINLITLGVTSLPNIETSLKIIILVVSIGYTAGKWYKQYKDGKKS